MTGMKEEKTHSSQQIPRNVNGTRSRSDKEPHAEAPQRPAKNREHGKDGDVQSEE